MYRRLRGFIEDDSGVALFTVMGVIMLMTISVMSAYFLSQQANTESGKAKSTQAAFQAANSGVDIALARIQAHGYVASEFPTTGVSPSTGASWEVSVTPQAGSSYLCVSRGVDVLGVVQTIKVKFFYFSLWNMEIANAGGVSNPSGGSVVGNTSVFGPLYCRGSVQLSGSSNIDMGPLLVNQGGIFLNSSGSNIGSVAYGPIDVYVSGASPAVGSSGYYTSSVSNAVPNIVLPLVDAGVLAERWTDAKNQSADNKRGDGYPADPANVECTTIGDGSTYTTVNPPNDGVRWYSNNAYTTRQRAPGAAANFYKLLGNPATQPIPGTPTSSLTIDNATAPFGSWPGNPEHITAVGDDFAYDGNGHLYVWGVVYVDGPITFNRPIYYSGNGTLVANGNITINDKYLPDTSAVVTTTPPPVSQNNMDLTHSVGLVTPYNITANQTGGTNKSDPYDVPDVCGAFFSGGSFTIGGHPLVKGSILANTINFQDPNPMLVTDPRLPGYLPAGMPAAGQSLLYKGSWTRQ